MTSSDPILHVVAPVSLAAAAGTALIIDRDSAGGWPFRVGSLEQLVASGPSAADLHPTAGGVAVLGGPADPSAALDRLIDAVSSTWPAVVLRSPAGDESAVRIEPALPWRPPADVTVATGLHRSEATVPAPPSWLLRRILDGHVDGRWRWLRHWRAVWERCS